MNDSRREGGRVGGRHEMYLPDVGVAVLPLALVIETVDL